MPTPTPEEKAAFNAFIKDYGELVAKHKMDFMAYPSFQPDEQGGWKITIQTQAVPTKNQPIKSPFMSPK